jgi:hypothetical protein
VFVVLTCVKCGLLFQPLAPAGALLDEIYDSWIPEITTRQIYQDDDLQTSRYRIDQVDFLIQATGLRPAEVSFLDFGSGWSQWLCVARAFGCDVAGAELSESRRRYASTLGIPMLDEQELSSRRFDVINLEQVVEHLVDPAGILSTLRNSLNDNGIIRVSVPEGRGMAKRLASASASTGVQPGDLMPIHPLEHLNCFTQSSLATMGAALGLRVVTPSLSKLYDSVSGWWSFSGVKRNLLRPIYRHVYPKSTIVYFAKA